MRRPKLEFRLPERGHLTTLEVDDPAADVLIGLRASPHTDGGKIFAEYRYEHRSVEEETEVTAIGLFDVIINAKKVYPDPSFHAMEAGAPRFELWSRVRNGCESVLHSWIEDYGSSYERPAELGAREEIFWAYFHALYQVAPHQWADVIVARREDGTEISAGVLSAEVKYGKLAYVYEGYERVDDLISSPGNIAVLTIRPFVDLSVLVESSTDLIDISKTRQNLAILEGAEARFMQKQPTRLEVPGNHAAAVSIDRENMRGQIVLKWKESTATNELSIDLYFRGRFVETRRILVPLGAFSARINGDDFVMNPTFNKVESGHREVWPVAREAAAQAIIELCEQWDRNPAVTRTRIRALLLSFLSQASTDKNSATSTWQDVCDRLESVKIFRRATHAWCDYRALMEIQDEFDEVRWLHDHDLNTSSWRGVPARSIAVIEEGVSDMISRLPTLRWKHAKDVAAQLHQQEQLHQKDKSATDEPEREPLEGLEPDQGILEPQHMLSVQLGEILRLVREDRSVLLSDAILSDIEVGALSSEEIVEVTATKVVLNEDHPAVRAALDDTDDAVTLSFLGSAVYTAINVFYGEITDEHEVEFQTRYASWMRGVVDA